MTTQPVDDRPRNTNPVYYHETTDQHTQADDLVERLTKRANTYTWDSTTFYTSDAELMRTAAATIKELKAEVEALGGNYDTATREWALAEARAAKAEEALREIRDFPYGGFIASSRMQGIAKKHLGEGKA